MGRIDTSLADSVPFERLTVRPLTLRDVNWLMPVERDIYPFPWTPRNFLDSIRAKYQGWVLHSPGRQSGEAAGDNVGDERLHGYAVVMHVLDEAHLLNLSIARRFQGVGLGGYFLRWLMLSSFNAGAAGMFLEVRPSNEAALRLYKRHQFQIVGKRPGYYPDHDGRREDALVMRRSLGDRSELHSIPDARSDGCTQ